MHPQIQQLLTDLARTPSLVCTVSREGAVSELFLDGAPQKIEFADPWVTIEFKSWHIHVDVSVVTQVRFTEAPGHDNSVSAFAAFDDSQGKSVLRFTSLILATRTKPTLRRSLRCLDSSRSGMGSRGLGIRDWGLGEEKT